jgi:hypothetical protein
MTEQNLGDRFLATVDKINTDREQAFVDWYEANKATLGNIEKFTVKLIWDYGCNAGMKISNDVLAPKAD